MDCATIRLPPAERAMCPTTGQQAMGPDWLEYGYRAPRSGPTTARCRGPRPTRLISDFNHRVLTQQPVRVLAAYSATC